MNRFVVMVDAGYLLRHAIEIVSNRQSRSRGDLEIVDPAAMISAIVTKSRTLLALDGKELLRVYWYDGVGSGLTAQQRSIVDVDDVQFRAGTINSARQQKGVDSLIVTDLIELTTHKAVCDAVLVTGDSDLAVGMELAQRRGVRVAVLGIEDLAAGVAHHQSFEITSRADRVGRMGGADFTGVFRYSPAVRPTAAAPSVAPVPPASAGGTAAPAPSPVVPVPQPAVVPPALPLPAAGAHPAPRTLAQADEQAIEASVRAFVAQQASLAGAVDPATSRIDATVDRALIHHVFLDLSRGALTQEEKKFARKVFRGIV